MNRRTGGMGNSIYPWGGSIPSKIKLGRNVIFLSEIVIYKTSKGTESHILSGRHSKYDSFAERTYFIFNITSATSKGNRWDFEVKTYRTLLRYLHIHTNKRIEIGADILGGLGIFTIKKEP